jgi:EAL domain-containing protein (putative c-di-GMP-specific phosphodiesterase class I)
VAEDKVIRVTARCGIAVPVAGDDASSLLRRASAALDDARRSAISDICVRQGGGDGRGAGAEPDRLDADLRLALDRGEIGIVYQPQYDSLNDRIVGVEALARWNHPELGQLDAGTLFEAADRADFLLPLSRHIQARALDEAGTWPESLSALRLSVNVTAVDLAQGDFMPHLLEMIGRSGFPRDRVTVEITETGLIENIEQAGALLQELRKAGLRVAIDDFGTGYSSLAYLKALHPDYLKIDHSLSRDILGTPRDRIILRAIISMAKSLALTVIAEGVESEEQLTLLAREGCDIYQGFLRSRAVTGAELIEMVERAG